MIYFCSQKNRRALVLQSANLNGIDYLELVGTSLCGKQLAVTLLKDARSIALTPGNVVITGGTAVTIASIIPATDENPFVFIVNLNQTGDFSRYTLSLVAASGTTDPPAGFDPQLSSVDFSFKVGCPTPADCLPDACCPSPVSASPDINYLAKDYEGFRQVMLDRMATLSPAWKETHAADLGIALVETLAYAADQLSYQQDAVSTEAYLNTARSRISLRRHARLVDYIIGEGCNARAFVCVGAGKDNLVIPAGALFYVRVPGLPLAAKLGDPVAQQLAKVNQPVFASLQDATLFREQNEIHFYTWGDTSCCLVPGVTEATLAGNLTTLKTGDVLVFLEKCGPLTGDPQDADPTRRWAVCLTSVSTTDHLGNVLVDPLNAQLITRITWSQNDALPFPLCISSVTDAEHGSIPVAAVSVALGNVVAADHGVWIESEQLEVVQPAPAAPPAGAGCQCGTKAEASVARPRYYPELANSPLTFAVPFTGVQTASGFLAPDPGEALPQVGLQSDDGSSWTAEKDLLASDDTDHVFVPEIERDNSIFLRFGDGQYGKFADAGLSFQATYRVGNGNIGNIARDSLAHIVLPPTFLPPLAEILSVRNPLAASGGLDPEDMDHIRQYAPFAYETQLRCVTENDYGVAAAGFPGIREARGTLRWTGSWYTAFVSVDPVATFTAVLAGDTTRRLNLLRMMGTDLSAEGAVLVGLDIEMDICVAANHFQGDVFAALMKLFISGNQCSGQAGLLNPTNFSFGQTVYASPLVAAAQAVEGVLSATLTVFKRMDNPSLDGVAQGFLTMGRLEIARCDNDPNRLDHGIFVLHMDGGK